MTPAKRVLLVDDQKTLRLLVRATLGTEQFQLLEAADGNEALAVARAERPDLMLLDVGMPGPDGFEVCRQLKNDPETANVKIVMLTARSQAADRRKGLSLGVDAYLTKPFSPTELLDTIHQLLE